MAGTMTTASGQSSLFMITRSVALPGLVAPAGHPELCPSNSAPRPGRVTSVARPAPLASEQPRDPGDLEQSLGLGGRHTSPAGVSGDPLSPLTKKRTWET